MSRLAVLVVILVAIAAGILGGVAIFEAIA